MVLLRHGDTEGRFDGDGSRIVGSIVLDAVNHGVEPGYVRRLLADPSNRGGFACLRRRRRNLDRWFHAEWARAVALVAASPPLADRQEAAYRATLLAERVQARPWKGMAGATDRAVYLGVCRIAARAGRIGDLGLSVRELAEAAKVGAKTAARSLQRLEAAGLLRIGRTRQGRRPRSLGPPGVRT